MKFRKKPIVIDAEQWFPGKEIDGVQVRNCEAVYSRDRKYYYVVKGDLPCTRWLSVETFPGPVPEDKQNGILDGYVQFSPKGEGTYHRHVLPFSFYEVKSGDSEPLADDSKLFLDYGCVERWDKTALGPPRVGWIKTLEGTMNVIPGDWIITGVQGEKYPCKDEIFRATYEPAE
jgi:hypothetical protein